MPTPTARRTGVIAASVIAVVVAATVVLSATETIKVFEATGASFWVHWEDSNTPERINGCVPTGYIECPPLPEMQRDTRRDETRWSLFVVSHVCDVKMRWVCDLTESNDSNTVKVPETVGALAPLLSLLGFLNWRKRQSVLMRGDY